MLCPQRMSWVTAIRKRQLLILEIGYGSKQHKHIGVAGVIESILYWLRRCKSFDLMLFDF